MPKNRFKIFQPLMLAVAMVCACGREPAKVPDAAVMESQFVQAMESGSATVRLFYRDSQLSFSSTSSLYEEPGWFASETEMNSYGAEGGGDAVYFARQYYMPNQSGGFYHAVTAKDDHHFLVGDSLGMPAVGDFLKPFQDLAGSSDGTPSNAVFISQESGSTYTEKEVGKKEIRSMLSSIGIDAAFEKGIGKTLLIPEQGTITMFHNADGTITYHMRASGNGSNLSVAITNSISRDISKEAMTGSGSGHQADETPELPEMFFLGLQAKGEAR